MRFVPGASFRSSSPVFQLASGIARCRGGSIPGQSLVAPPDAAASENAALVVLPVAVAQRALEQLAGRRAGQLRFKVDRARAFVVRQTVAAEADQLRLHLRAALET